jgi:hypothetical protein
MTMMLIKGCRLVREDDNIYGVYDANQKLGTIVRWYRREALNHTGVPQFRTFGEDFDSLIEATAEFVKISSFKAYLP